MDSLRSFNFSELLERIGAKTAAPGGGAVASAAAALAGALGRMVVAYSIGKKNLAEHQEALARADEVLARSVALLLDLADEDARAYGLVNELSRLPEHDARRISEYPVAIDACIQAPRNVVAVCCDLLRLLEMLAPRSNRHLRSDLAIAAVLAESAARAAWWNVRVNLVLLPELPARSAIEGEVRHLLEEAEARRAGIERACE